MRSNKTRAQFLTSACCILALLLADSLSAWAQFGRTFSAAKAGEDSGEECTIGAACGRATKDGRPMIWKTRDSSPRNNAISYNSSARYRFIAVIDGGSASSSWMSINEKGFAILNSVASDLKAASSGPGNGSFMTLAVGTCASIAEFEQLLDSTNVTQRTTEANFAVMDSTGGAAIFETGGTSYWKFDAASPAAGYVLRTNFALNG